MHIQRGAGFEKEIFAWVMFMVNLWSTIIFLLVLAGCFPSQKNLTD
jgi:hypothetical protein